MRGFWSRPKTLADRALRVLAALVLLTSGSRVSGALGASTIAVGPQVPGDRAVFQFTSSTQTAHQTDQLDGQLTLIRGSGSNVRVELTTSAGDLSAVAAHYASNGTIEIPPPEESLGPTTVQAPPPPPTPFALQRFNQLVELTHGAPAAPHGGDSWKSNVSVPLPLGEAASVPVVVRVVAATDTTFDLEATGDASVVLTPPANQNSVSTASAIPVRLSVHTSAHFGAGKLGKATGTLHGVLSFTDRSVEFSSDWSLEDVQNSTLRLIRDHRERRLGYRDLSRQHGREPARLREQRPSATFFDVLLLRREGLKDSAGPRNRRVSGLIRERREREGALAGSLVSRLPAF